MSYVRAINESDLKPGVMKRFVLEGKPVAIGRAESGEIVAFDDTCTHEECSLAEGFMTDEDVTCPCHGARFDIHSGEVLALPAAIPINTYQVKTENGEVWVDVY